MIDLSTTDGLCAMLQRLDDACTGRLGVSACHLGTGEEVHWRDNETFRTASTIKLAVHASLLRRVRAGQVDLAQRVTLEVGQLVGGSGVLNVLRPGLQPTVADLCTLMIVVSDNTATNLCIDQIGGVDAVNEDLKALEITGVTLHRKLGYRPPPLVAGPQQPLDEPVGTLATATPQALCRLARAVKERKVIDAEASEMILQTLEHQHFHSGVPRSFVELHEPGDPPDEWPTVANKTGSVSGCRADVGIISLPGGSSFAYAAMADDLDDSTMTALSEGDQLLGRAGAALLRHWWAGPGPAPVRAGWPE